MSLITPNIPVLAEEQTWTRNQFNKNWGNFLVFRFQKGKPSIILPNILFILYFSLLQIVSIMIFIIDLNVSSSIQQTLMVLFLLLNLLCFYRFISTDPGISSRSDPIINLPEMLQHRNFCSQCKCSQSERVHHCTKCDVCIEDSYIHLSISKMCITNKNISFFCSICICTIVQGCLMV